MSTLQEIYLKLREVRTNENVTLRHASLLKSTYLALDGEERELKIRNYQAQAIIHLVAMTRFVLADDTGLGKSLTSLVSLCHLADRDPNLKVIIVATKSLTSQWVEEIARFCEANAFTVFLAKQAPKSRRETYRAWNDHQGRAVLVTRYGSVRNDIDTLQAFSGYTMITDEAAEYNNPDTRINQVMRLLSPKAKRWWALTATPIQNNLIEGYGIFSVVVPGLFPATKAQFIQQYCVTRLQTIGSVSGRKIPVIVGYKAGMVQHFRTLIDPFFLARSKSQVAKELPPVLIIKISTAMSSAQEELYLETLMKAENSQVSVESIENLSELYESSDKEPDKPVSKLAILTACQQIADHPGLLKEEGSSAKMAKLFEILEEGELKGEKVVVFSRFRTMIDLLEKESNNRGIKSVRITGAETSSTVRDDARKALMDPNSGVRICYLTKAGGVGLNLQAAKAIIFYDTPWSAGIYEQLVGRINRIGSTHNRTFAIHLVCQNTIDETVLTTLAKKLRLVDMIVGNRLSMDGVVGEAISTSEINELFEAEMARRNKKAK